VKIIRDCFGPSVRLTDERVAPILQHQEMAGMERAIERVLTTPNEIRVSRSDKTGGCSTDSIRRHVWVRNGCVSW